MKYVVACLQQALIEDVGLIEGTHAIKIGMSNDDAVDQKAQMMVGVDEIVAALTIQHRTQGGGQHAADIGEQSRQRDRDGVRGHFAAPSG